MVELMSAVNISAYFSISGRVGSQFRVGLLWPDLLADEREQKRLRRAHDSEFVLDISGAPDTAIGANDTNAEELLRHTSRSWMHLRIRTSEVEAKRR